VNKATGGYDGESLEDQKVKPPEDCEWEVRYLYVGQSEEDPSSFAVITLDGEPIGSVRVPNSEYIRWLRERIQG